MKFDGGVLALVLSTTVTLAKSLPLSEVVSFKLGIPEERR